MQPATKHNTEAPEETTGPIRVSLDRETRAAVDTATAAFHLNRQPQTLRAWASAETFPEALRPRRVSGRLAWPVSGLRKVLGLAE